MSANTIKTKHLVLKPEEGKAFALFPLSFGVTERKTGRRIGTISFGTHSDRDVLRLTYSFAEPRDRNGYLPEAVKFLAGAAFDSLPDLFYFEAELAADDVEAWTALEKSKYTLCGFDSKGPVYVTERPAFWWMPVTMAIGAAFGVWYGSVLGSYPAGIGVMMCTGLAIGALADARSSKKRSDAKSRRRFVP